MLIAFVKEKNYPHPRTKKSSEINVKNKIIILRPCTKGPRARNGLKIRLVV